jgi:hypothetical protein
VETWRSAAVCNHLVYSIIIVYHVCFSLSSSHSMSLISSGLESFMIIHDDAQQSLIVSAR